jgi:hypothetical protein
MGADQFPVADVTKMKGKTKSKNVKTRFGKTPFCHDNFPVFQYSTIPSFQHSPNTPSSSGLVLTPSAGRKVLRPGVSVLPRKGLKPPLWP